MLRYANWRGVLTLIAMAIVIVTIFYSRYLAHKIQDDERQKVEAWVEAQRFIANSPADYDILFATIIIAGQQTIPVIETDEKDSITNYHNLDSVEVVENPLYLNTKLTEFRVHKPIFTYLGNDSTKFNKYYYGESLLLKQVRYYPFIQLIIVALFIIVTIIAINSSHKSMQNQLWAGMAKETAHQLGTPVSALHGWMEMLRETGVDEKMVSEIEKDVKRLKLVSDRFSKIGSTPQLENRDVIDVLKQVMEYVRKRSPEKVSFSIDTGALQSLMIPLSNPLFDWVIENLLKNALDAMGGKGSIIIHLTDHPSKLIIDVTDTGKGIPATQLSRVFNPGFTTKKRGWGLGLTLSKRIIEDYHKGSLFVKHSELGKGTTFRIIIPKNNQPIN